MENMVSNLFFIGTVVAPGPIYRRNALKKLHTFLGIWLQSCELPVAGHPVVS